MDDIPLQRRAQRVPAALPFEGEENVEQVEGVDFNELIARYALQPDRLSSGEEDYSDAE